MRLRRMSENEMEIARLCNFHIYRVFASQRRRQQQHTWNWKLSLIRLVRLCKRAHVSMIAPHTIELSVQCICIRACVCVCCSCFVVPISAGCCCCCCYLRFGSFVIVFTMMFRFDCPMYNSPRPLVDDSKKFTTFTPSHQHTPHLPIHLHVSYPFINMIKSFERLDLWFGVKVIYI